jgi:S1-C subfamily serine protease
LGIGSGVLVLEVPSGGPADKAGLRGTRRTETGLIEIGDIIIKVGEQVINTESDLFQALEEYKVGDSVKVIVGRATALDDELQIKEIELIVTLQASTDVQRQPEISFQ